MVPQYTDDQWRAFHAEAVQGMKSGKYSRIGQFCAEKGIKANRLWYVCSRLGLPTNFKSHAKTAGKKTNGKFVQFAPVQAAQIEMQLCGGRIKILVPREDIASIKLIADAFKEVA